MEVKEIIKKIYIAEDGKEFLSEEKCLEYEDKILCIRYYLIISHPSIRNYQDIFVLAAVYNRNRNSSSHYSIAFKWAMDKFGLLQKNNLDENYYYNKFVIRPASKEEYDKCEDHPFLGKRYNTDRIFLSPIKIEGFPDPIWNI